MYILGTKSTHKPKKKENTHTHELAKWELSRNKAQWRLTQLDLLYIKNEFHCMYFR